MPDEVFDLKPTRSPVALRVLASLRLCVRLFLQAIDDTGDAVRDQRRVEVDEQAKPLVPIADKSEAALVNGREDFDRFDLDDHPVLDNQVCPEPRVDPDCPVDHWDCLFAWMPNSINLFTRLSPRPRLPERSKILPQSFRSDLDQTARIPASPRTASPAREQPK